VAAVTVLKFSESDGAEKALSQIKSLQQEHLIKVLDAAIVSWPRGKKSPKTRQLVDLVTVGAMGGMFWGMLLGVIFLTPLFGMAIGAAFGALGGAFRDYGIDDEFIKRVRSSVTEGTSALFLMSSDAVMDRVSERMKNFQFEIIATNLSKDQEDQLRNCSRKPSLVRDVRLVAHCRNSLACPMHSPVVCQIWTGKEPSWPSYAIGGYSAGRS
jgi:uncharacterized membrane protein